MLIDQDVSPTFSRPQSPFALCGVLLVVDALVDLIIITKVPHMNEILATAEAARYRGPDRVLGGGSGSPHMNPFLARLASLYSEIWTLISAARFCLFFAVSFFIYQSKPGAWGMSNPNPVVGGYQASGGEETMSGLDHLKNRVVFTYGFVEMSFWLWVSAVHIRLRCLFAWAGVDPCLDFFCPPRGTATGRGSHCRDAIMSRLATVGRCRCTSNILNPINQSHRPIKR